MEVWQIGNEGGFLAAPVNLTANHGNRLLMGLAERADLIVDFTNVPVGNYVLGNVGPGRAIRRRRAGDDFTGRSRTTGQIMQFRVGPGAWRQIRPPHRSSWCCRLSRHFPRGRRPLALGRDVRQFSDGPAKPARYVDRRERQRAGQTMWTDAVTENPAVGDTEVWEFYNLTADAHPMHIHEVVFEVVNRQTPRRE